MISEILSLCGQYPFVVTLKTMFIDQLAEIFLENSILKA